MQNFPYFPIEGKQDASTHIRNIMKNKPAYRSALKTLKELIV